VSELRIWSPKWLKKVLTWLRLGSLREIGMIPPARYVLENGSLTGLEKLSAICTVALYFEQILGIVHP